MNLRSQRMGRESLSPSVDINLFDREMNETFLIQTAKQFSASHILQDTVGLLPIPDSTELSGDESPSLLLVLIDKRTNEDEVLGGNWASPNDEILLHACVYNRKLRETPAKNEDL
jgi:hypothetical protein